MVQPQGCMSLYCCTVRIRHITYVDRHTLLIRPLGVEIEMPVAVDKFVPKIVQDGA